MGRRILFGTARALAVLLALAPVAARAAGDDAGALVRKAVDALPKKTFEAKMKLTPSNQPPGCHRYRTSTAEGSSAAPATASVTAQAPPSRPTVQAAR